MSQAAILYDADCGFCRWSADKILAWDVHRRLRPVALQDPEADRLLGGMDPGRKMASWHLVSPDGRIHFASEAISELLRLLPARSIPSAGARRPTGTSEGLSRGTTRAS